MGRRIVMIAISAILAVASVSFGPAAAQSPEPSLSPSFLPLASGDSGILAPSLDPGALAEAVLSLDPALLEDPTAAAQRPDESMPGLSGLLVGLAASDPDLAPLAEAAPLFEQLQAQLLGEIREKVAPDGSVGPPLASIGGPVPVRSTRAHVDTPDVMSIKGGELAELLYIVEVLGAEIFNVGKVKEAHEFTMSATKDDTTATMGMQFGEPGADSGITVTVEKNGMKLTARLSGHTSGDRCPDADGKVRMEFTARLQGGMTGAGASVTITREMKGSATATVNDAAYITGDIAMDVTGSYAHTGGDHNAYVETRMTATVSVGDWSSTEAIRRTTSTTQDLARLIRVSQHATWDADGVPALETVAQATGFAFVMMAIWQATWRDGHSCVKVQGTIPMSVSTSSATPIDLRVVHRDGQPLDQPIEATLKGTQSLDPTRLEHAPGTVTYTAGDKPDTRSDLTFTSTSRRGIGKLEGPVWTEGPSYEARSIPGVRSWKSACIDRLDRGPIVLSWKDETPGANTQGTFTLDPESATSGTLTEVTTGKGKGWSFSYKGKGNYDVTVFVSGPDGSPEELQIAYATTGKMRQCAGGRCTTSKVQLAEAFIPIDVRSERCPTAP